MRFASETRQRQDALDLANHLSTGSVGSCESFNSKLRDELLAAEQGIMAALDIAEHDQLAHSLRLLLARYGTEC